MYYTEVQIHTHRNQYKSVIFCALCTNGKFN